MDRIVIDIDFLLYAAACAVEERYIVVTHIPTNEVREFSTKTDFWGSKRNRDGGWIREENARLGADYYRAEDFEVEEKKRFPAFKWKSLDKRNKTPLNLAQEYFNFNINKICKKLKVRSWKGYTGTGKTFRHERATLLEYKGQRQNFIPPLILDELKAWVATLPQVEVVVDIEADDAVSIATNEGYQQWVKAGRKGSRTIAVGVDKDSKQTNGWHYNPDHDEEPRLIEGFGKLWRKDKKVDGEGRLWLYWQILHGDITDNYVTNCFSEKRWGDVAAYNALVDCKTDKEAWESMVKCMQALYPEKKTVDGCKGLVEIDWLYVLQEMCDMAFMLRRKGDRMIVTDILSKLGVDYVESKPHKN